VLVIAVIILVGVVGFLGFNILSNNSNNTTNTTNNTSVIEDQSNTSSDNKSVSNGTAAVKITSTKAKGIASDYLASTEGWENTAAGNPSLKGDVYYVPIKVTKEGQHSVGTVIGYVKVDAQTGQVLGIQVITIE
jgi:hypothetical protein